MFIIVVAPEKVFRQKTIATLIEDMGKVERIVLDDTMSSFADMEQYIYPSLFVSDAPIIHAKYLLDAAADVFTVELAKKLAASPTIFIFEELTASTPLLTVAKKHGALVYVPEKSQPKMREGNDIFAATTALTAKDKKSRWLAFHAVLLQHPIEAIMGILYWKVRDMAGKNVSGSKELYRALLLGHAESFQKGIPLAVAIEKVILEH